MERKWNHFFDLAIVRQMANTIENALAGDGKKAFFPVSTQTENLSAALLVVPPTSSLLYVFLNVNLEFSFFLLAWHIHKLQKFIISLDPLHLA